MKSKNIISILLVVGALALAVSPCIAEDFWDFYEQGEFALRVEKWQTAIALFTKSIEDNPKFYVAYHNRAIAYSKMGEYDKSIEDLKKAVELNPDYPDAYGLLGVVYEIKKDYPAALKAYQEAMNREKRPAAKKALQKYVQDMETKLKKK